MKTFSNSKITAEQNELRKDALLQLFDGGGFIRHYDNLTVAVSPDYEGSEFAKLSVSYCSEKEIKNRRKVGEFHALEKMFTGKFIKIPAYAELDDIVAALCY